MKNIGKWICVILCLVIITGCTTRQVLTTVGLGAAAAGGAAAVYYIRGDLEADLDNPLDKVYRATQDTMAARGYAIKDRSIGDSSGRVDATIPASGGESERSLTIKLTRKDANVTNLSIRVGVFGNETLSRAILSDIQAKL